MVFSHKIFGSIDVAGSSSDSDSELDILDKHQIDELENKLKSNYNLLRSKKHEIKQKKKDNYLLDSISSKYDEMNNLMDIEQKKLIKHLQLLNKYIEKNKLNNKKILLLLENEKKYIKKELKKINYIQNI
jgi:hypothetical protein